MQLISFTKDDKASYGILEGNSITDLGARLGDEYPDLKSLLAGGMDAASAVEPTADLTLDDVDLLPVIPNPPNVRYSSGFDSSSDDDVPLSMRLPKKKCSLPKSVSPIDPDPVRTALPVPAQTIVTSGGSGIGGGF